MKKLILLTFLGVGLASCDSSSELGREQATLLAEDYNSTVFESVVATLVDEGDPSVDGCGWMIYLGEERYKPVNLSDDFKVNDLEVTISFQKTESIYRCGLAATPFDEVEVSEIEEN